MATRDVSHLTDTELAALIDIHAHICCCAAPSVGAVRAVGLVGAHAPDVRAEVRAEREVDRAREHVEHGGEAGVRGRLGLVEHPAQEADADGQRVALCDAEAGAHSRESFAQRVR